MKLVKSETTLKHKFLFTCLTCSIRVNMNFTNLDLALVIQKKNKKTIKR